MERLKELHTISTSPGDEGGMDELPPGPVWNLNIQSFKDVSRHVRILCSQTKALIVDNYMELFH